jgi:hypothetical protein
MPGVEISVIDWGGLGGMAYLDYWFGLPVPFTTFYNSFIKSMQYIGYEEGKNLFGAPYGKRSRMSNAIRLDFIHFSLALQRLANSQHTTGVK